MVDDCNRLVVEIKQGEARGLVYYTTKGVQYRNTRV